MTDEAPAGSRFRVEQIDHVELFVPDRHQAAGWYSRVLGLQVIPEYEFWAEDPRGPLMISSDGGGTKLALFEGDSQGQRPTAGFHRVAFRVRAPAFLAFLAKVEKLKLVDHESRGVTERSAVDHDLSFSIYFSDPFGHRLELTSYDHTEIRTALAAVETRPST